MFPTLDPAKKRAGQVISLIGSVVMGIIIGDPHETWVRVKDLGWSFHDAPLATFGLGLFLVLLAWLSWQDIWRWFGGKRWRDDKALQQELYDWLHAKDLKLSDAVIADTDRQKLAFAFIVEDKQGQQFAILKERHTPAIVIKTGLQVGGSTNATLVKQMNELELAELQASLVLELTRHGLTYTVHGGDLVGQGIDVLEEARLSDLTADKLYGHLDLVQRALMFGRIIVWLHIQRARAARGQLATSTPPQSVPDTEDSQSE